MHTTLLDQFSDTGLDWIVSWPYDEGGCGCSECWPWGARGHVQLSKEISQLVRRKYPRCRFVLSTWVYDSPPAGEWTGLATHKYTTLREGSGKVVS